MRDVATDLCAQLGIRVVPCAATNAPSTTKAVNVISRIIEDHGVGHATLTLRTIVESAGNDRALQAPVIWAVSDVILAHPGWADRGLAWIEAFDEISLSALAKSVKGNRGAAAPRAALSTLIYVALKPIFDPPKVRPPRKVYQHKRGPRKPPVMVDAGVAA